MPVNPPALGPSAHHDGSPLYVSDPAPRVGQKVDVFVRTSKAMAARGVHVRSTPDGEPAYTEALVDRETGDEVWWRASVPVVNAELGYRFLIEPGKPGRRQWLNGTGLHDVDVTDTADFKLPTYDPPPAWAEGAVVYEIFPDRFARSAAHPVGALPDWAVPAEWDDPVPYGTPAGTKQVYRGTLWGIAEKLDYLRGLGIDALYLTPFFPSRSNHRYDASSFDFVDPLLGGDEALKELTAQAHLRGIKVLGDITLNHTGDMHPWFRRGQADPASAEAGFYYFGADRHQYASFFGVPSLPKLDHRSEELRRRLYEGPDSVIARYPAEFGLDGWRVDVAQSAGRYGAIDLNARMARSVRETLRAVAPETLLLAEHQFDASATLQGDGWHGTMAYAGFTRPVLGWLGGPGTPELWGVPGPAPVHGGGEMAAVMRQFAALIPWRAVTHNMTLLDSHDMPRFRSVVGAERQALGVALLMTLPGLPMVFAGDEVGVAGALHTEDGRRPFPWDEGAWDQGTYEVYRSLIALRRSHAALRSGGLRWLHAAEDFVLFERALPEETVVVQVSRTAHEPVAAPFAASHLLGGPDLVPGAPLPSDGPAFHVWRVERG
ncbi:glycoside hydrolase family 13 protein [Catenulispora sp. NF23]|uniref:Glycoside hydrolase family 13 protein n=1 Tax=Catenulispora pinistramenti TaxID=2705254 RepID=A0ABS5KMJ2_9ACTN|nr:glycoside hydrolase family 13 protein [Catenulispora pinistramenti]MBS2532921.1 glycoside hydrolase family 13 protein [Catenulispora pinistramenti]MBS2547224.1 glycoside hydrolase family 13 protein [Catenulispora pinistramenti]